MKIDFPDVLAVLGYCYFSMVTVINCGNRLQLLEITFSGDLSFSGYYNHYIGSVFAFAATLTQPDLVTVTASGYCNCSQKLPSLMF